MSRGRVGKLFSVANTNESQHLARAYYMPGTVAGILCTISFDYHKAL